MNNLIKYFIDDNKSGHRTREKWLINNNINLYNNIINYCNGELSTIQFKLKIWHYINDINYIPQCECGTNLNFKKSLREGYGTYCSISCTNKSDKHINLVKETNIKKYGGVSPSHSDDIKDKIKKTTLDKYGVDNIFKDVKYIKEKTIEKHGISHISKLSSVKNKIRETNISKYGVSSPLLINKNRLKGYDKKKNDFIIKYKELKIIDIIKDDVIIKCGSCNNNYSIDRNVLYYRYQITTNPCTICHPKKSGVSISESEIIDFIASLGINLVSNTREVIAPLELDIYIPTHDIAIEYNGLYWHSEKYVNNGYHLNKTELCNNINVKLIHIFEDEWLYKKDIVKSRLKNLLGFTDERIYGRKCEIKEVKTKDKTIFLNENHIQGAVGSKYNIGLYYDDELVSIMTFSNLRKVLGLNHKDNNYELIRFCNKLNTTVIGGASKLLKYFIKTYSPSRLISYADRRWSTGNLYDKLDFKYMNNSKPNYFYVINNKREHRFKYRKDMLISNGYDPKLTEHQIMTNRQIYRIYDCGTITYEKIIS